MSVGAPDQPQGPFTALVIPAHLRQPCRTERIPRGVLGYLLVSRLVGDRRVRELAFDLDAHLYVASRHRSGPVNARVTRYVQRHSLLAGSRPEARHVVRGDAVVAGSRGPIPFDRPFGSNACDVPARFYQLFGLPPPPRPRRL